MGGEVRFIISADSMYGLEGYENWDGSEFNVFYTEGKKTRMLVYGDINEGIITASYRNDPVDLEQGSFFKASDRVLTPMTEKEKADWIVEIG